MNRTDLINRIAESAVLSRAEATRALDAMLFHVTEELNAGGNVRLIDFGSFIIGETKERDVRHPSSGEKIRIAAKRRVKFTAGKALREMLNTVSRTGCGGGRDHLDTKGPMIAALFVEPEVAPISPTGWPCG